MPKRILFIEDEPDMVELLRARFESCGFIVFTANDGHSGLKMAAEKNPDIIILDVVMPGLDGHEVCMRLKDDLKTHSIPVLVLTATGEKDVVSRMKRLGAADCFMKPFDPQVLVERINALVNPV